MDKMEKIVALAKRRGFVYPSSEIYGGLGSVYDYGPMGVELLRNIRGLWWNHFVHSKNDIVGIESQIFMHPKVWKASGHEAGFNEPLVDCKKCQARFRADHLISDNKSDLDPDDYDNKGLDKLIEEFKIACPNCGEHDWTASRDFNGMFKTHRGATESKQSLVYLRPETAQGMFVQFKNVLDTTRQKVPFGIAQIGKAFRNEITKGKFIFRTLEFEQMEVEFFFKEEDWEEAWDTWRAEIEKWYTNALGLSKKSFVWKPHHPDKLSHYAKKAEDYQYKYATGFDEVSGLHYRTGFDLETHQKNSGVDLSVEDEKGKKYIPHVMEATFGLNRNLLMILTDAYHEEEKRVVLKLNPQLAPFKAAVFPLLSNKPELVKKAKEIYKGLLKSYSIAWDERGNIGKRYFAQDEIGTPYCITIDFDTLEKDSVTVRNRDTAEQERVAVDKLSEYLQNKIEV